MQPPRLVLASESPRRRKLLERLGLEFVIRPPKVDEALLPSETPAAAAERLARRKAATFLRTDHLTIGCDTVVAHRGAVLGKPGSVEEAETMLLRLSGDEHTVYTGIALAEPSRVESSVESTRVWFRPLTRRDCREYAATGEPLDKAGGYGVQGLGAALVERIEGDFFNVMGLPIPRLLRLFEAFGWRYAYGGLVPADPAAGG